MAVSDTNKRISVKITKEEYEEIEILAKIDNRSVSNFISKLVKDYLSNTKKD